MTANTLRIVSRGKDYSRALLQHLPKLWLRAPVRFELSCAADDDTEAALDAVGEYSITIQGLTASRTPDDTAILWYGTSNPELDNSAKSKGPHAIFELDEADIANVADAGEYWISFHAYVSGERIVRAAGYITFIDDGFPDSPPTPTPPGTIYLTQAAGDARYVRDPGTVTDNRLVRWDGTSGNQVQSSGVTVDDAGNLTTTGTLTVGSISASAGISASTLRVAGTFQADMYVDNLTGDHTFDFPDDDGVFALTGETDGKVKLVDLKDVTITTPSTGQVLTWNGTAWVNSNPSGGGGGGAVNLPPSRAATAVTITPSRRGTAAEIPQANATHAGVMSADHHNKLNGIQEGAEANVNADWSAVSGDAAILNKPTIPSVAGITFANGGSGALTVTGAASVSGTNTGNVSLATSVSSVLTLSGQQLQAVTDPGSDQILFYDQSASAWAYASLGSSLVMTGTTLSVSLGAPGPIGGTTPGEGTFNQINARTGIDVQATVGPGGPLRVYNTATTAPSDYERGRIEWVSNVLTIGTESIGGGIARAMALQTGGVTRMLIGANGYTTVRGATSASGAVLNVKSDSVGGSFVPVIRVERNDSTSATAEMGQTSNANGYVRLFGTSGTVQIEGALSIFPAAMSVGTSTNSSRMHVRGAGTTTGLALLVENSSGTARFTVRDDGAFAFAGGTVAVAETGWTAFTNWTALRTCDVNTVTVQELARIVGTMRAAMVAKGILAV